MWNEKIILWLIRNIRFKNILYSIGCFGFFLEVDLMSVVHELCGFTPYLTRKWDIL